MKNEESTALAHPPTTPIPTGHGEWGWSEGGPGQYQSSQHYYLGRNAEQTPPSFPRVARWPWPQPLCSNVAVEKDRWPPKIIGREWP